MCDMQLNSDSIVWFPLSDVQRSRWFLYQLDPAGRGCHNNGFAVCLHGPLDLALIERALQQMVNRHPMLRTCIRSNMGVPEQSIAEQATVALSVREACEASLAQDVQRDCYVPFDLEQPPLVRAHLYVCDEEKTVMLLVFDHIAVDGWSYWQLIDELGASLQNPDAIALPSGGAQYEDYICAQAAWRETVAASKQLDYWKNILAGDLPVLQLPYDSQRLDTGGHEQAIQSVILPAELTSALRGLARKHAGNLYTTLSSAHPCQDARAHSGMM
jgi:hypothetical protein